MLEIRNLTKIYRPKRGVPVTALDHVSMRLPSHGLVFLLGKSGSGKSTLLNLLGGLDKADEGEILIRNASTAGFGQQHFDSYRNTYVGFIFQEYNVLEEFTVGANIALAIELQGKKATDAQINAILHEVDLDGFGSRRPNELSGGQKQRVAIARALVKQPRIIMADEPTGALDSNTGRQIFDTLKRLSANRLVLVVSHDREFAEQYADRIIELADGKILSDMTYTRMEESVVQEITFTDETVEIPAGYQLTEADRLAINEYMAHLDKGISLKAAKNARLRATPTDPETVPVETGGFSLIRSRLPLRSAFKIGSSSLGHKKFRLAVTIFLSCVSFCLFGMADTFGSYNHIQACTDSILDSGVDYASMTKSVLVTPEEENKSPYYDSGYRLYPADLAAIEDYTGLSMTGVYLPKNCSLDFSANLNISGASDEETRVLQVYPIELNGFAEVTERSLATMGYSLAAGRLPDGKKDELLLPAFVAEGFCKLGYVERAADGAGATATLELKTAADMVGLTLILDDRAFTVVGIVDTKVDISRYAPLLEKREDMTTAEELAFYALMTECRYMCNNSLHATALVGEGYVQARIAADPAVKRLSHSSLWFNSSIEDETGEFDSISLDPYWIGRLEDVPEAAVLWLGEAKTSLSEKELVVSLDLLGRLQTDGVTQREELRDAAAALLQSCNSFTEESRRIWNNRELADTADDYRIVGVLDSVNFPLLEDTVVTENAFYAAMVPAEEGVYSFAVGPMPEEYENVRALVGYCYSEDGTVQFPLANAVTYELDMVHEALVACAKVFLWIGLFFALFASLMLANFIAVSIHYKRQEIGILRAIGSRSNDVFRIFFAESFIIAMVNFLLSSIGVGVITAYINHMIRARLNVLITILSFGPRQLFLLLAVSLLVAVLASFFPVRRIAAKRPIDAIRGR